MRAALSATSFASLGNLLSSHRAITRVSMAILSFILIAGVSQQPAAQAGPESAPVVPESLLPQSVGIAVDTTAPVTIPFDAAMDAASVESALQLLPAHSVALSWNSERTALTVSPERLWRSDEQYLIVVGAASAKADGTSLGSAERFAFSTATAPAVTDFQVRLASADLEAIATQVSLRAAALASDADPLVGRVASPLPPTDGAVTAPPTRTADEVSASSSIEINFSAPMDMADVEDRFTIAPEVTGELSWRGGDLVFSPTERLEAGTRYTISVIGSHDAEGNLLGGKGNFSFIVQPGATLTKTEPDLDAVDVEPSKLTMWFSQPMDRERTGDALKVTDASGARVEGSLRWNDESTQVSFVPKTALAPGTTFEVSLGKGGRDADGNGVKAAWSFTTKAAPVVAAPVAAPAAPARSTVTTRSAPSIPPPAPATSLAGYALNQVNAARAAYGFAPLVLDSAISAVAASHAMDQAANGYFSHYGQNGSSRQQRLAAGGVSFGYSGENQCYHEGMSQQATLNWCHAQFMAEPYPGHWNHIANILDPRFHRMGVGIATVGSRTVITWNFTD